MARENTTITGTLAVRRPKSAVAAARRSLTSAAAQAGKLSAAA